MPGKNLLPDMAQGRNLFPDMVVQQTSGKLPVADTDPSLAEQARTPSLQERGAEIFGLDPNIEQRGTILPIGRNKQGETELAVPQVGVDILNSLIAPGEAAKGTPITHEDALKFTLDFAAPASSIRGASGAGTRRQFVKDAPTTSQLREQSRTALGKAKAGGTVVRDDSFKGFVDDLGVDLAKAGASDELHPKVTAAFKALASEGEFAARLKASGVQGLDVDDLVTKRRQIGVALRSTEPDEARLAGQMAEKFDEFVANLKPGDILGGSNRGTQEVAENLARFRKLWARAAKSDTIEAAVDAARQAGSGFENGMRVEFRKILNNPKRSKGFSKVERQAMRRVVNGGPVRSALRVLGKLSFGTNGGSNFLGGTIGVGAGGMLAGPVGGMVAPAVGFAAQRGAQRSTENAARLARAIAATGRSAPQRGINPTNAPAAAQPVLGALPNSDNERGLRARLLSSLLGQK